MISTFSKHPVHLKWHQIFWNTLCISNDVKFFETPCTSQMISTFFSTPSLSQITSIFWKTHTSQMISNFLKHLVHFQWYLIFWNTLYISNDIESFETLYISYTKYNVYGTQVIFGNCCKHRYNQLSLYKAVFTVCLSVSGLYVKLWSKQPILPALCSSSLSDTIRMRH